MGWRIYCGICCHQFPKAENLMNSWTAGMSCAHACVTRTRRSWVGEMPGGKFCSIQPCEKPDAFLIPLFAKMGDRAGKTWRISRRWMHGGNLA